MKKALLLFLAFIPALLFVSCASSSVSSSSSATAYVPYIYRSYATPTYYYNDFYTTPTTIGFYDADGYNEVDRYGNLSTYGYDGSTSTFFNDGSYTYTGYDGSSYYYDSTEGSHYFF